MLRAHGQTAHRCRANAPKARRPPATHIATAAGQVWPWDMTYLPADDNAYAESLFRTAKYRPEFPSKGFEPLEAARQWGAAFVHWYQRTR